MNMNSENLDFNKDFSSDDEVDEALDSLLKSIGEKIDIEDSRTAIVNPFKIQQLLCTYKIARYLTKGEKGVKVSYKLHTPYKSMGSVSITGKEIVFRRPDWFMAAIKFSNNLDVYPKTDGTMQMDFTFHGLTQPLDL